MDGMKRFVETIRGIGWGLSRDENIAKARKIVSELNRFLYARHDGLGTLQVLGQEVLDELAKETPIGRLGTPEDIANAICFLASDEASFITGQVLVSDGGFIN